MSLISIQNLSFSYATNYEMIFDNVSFQLDSNWKLGLIGKNGKGKTTLLRLLTGEYEYQGIITSKVAFSYFPFEIIDKNSLIIDIVESYLFGMEEWKIKKELMLLQLDDNIMYRVYNTLSNGEQVKIMLAILFLKDNNFLLIDEPTNHLDLASRQVVSRYLNDKEGFILVSHDRQFLNDCIDYVMSINNNSIDIQRGNYDTWKMNKDNMDNYELMKNEKLKKDIKKLDLSAKRSANWSNKVEKSKNIGSGKPRGARLDQGVKPDKGHIGKTAAKMMKRSKSAQKRKEQALGDKKELLQELDVIEALSLNNMKHHSKRLIEAIDLSLYYGEREIVEKVTFTIEQGERIALIGMNGSGKSSLIKYLLGEHIKHTGTFMVVSNLKVSYVAQDTSFLKGSLKDYIILNELDEPRFKSILRKLGFSRNQFDKELEEYSSGQKKKVLIANSLMQKAQLYVWDEALNYLDIMARIQIENLLIENEATILFVEHDWEFVKNIATNIIDLTNF